MSKIVFVIDDSISNLTMAEDALSASYSVMTIPSGAKAVSLLEKVRPEIILLDIEMPAMDGFDVLRYLKASDRFCDIPVIFLTAKIDHATEIEALKLGVVDFISKPFNPAVLLNRVKHHIDVSSLVRERTKELYSVRHDIIFVLADMVENRDESTGDHLGRTSRLVNMLLMKMLESKVYHDEINTWDFEVMAECSLLHDVGKISTPDAILKKPGKLTVEEFEIMKEHTVAGRRILDKVIARSGENIFLRNAKLFAISHHERWNGTGYPFGLRGQEIPLHGRIMAIVDVFDALMSKRVYKNAYLAEHSLEIIVKERGEHFDPQIVDVFVSIWDRIAASYAEGDGMAHG
ncbi:MAG: response regulator [Defluviitaleaceae bacterium]|nr:response regulator [Defluviitaleaceae bacterium]